MATTTQATTNFSSSVVDAIVRTITQNLRSGLPWLPKGVVSFDTLKVGENGLFRHFAYPDLGLAPTIVEGVPPVAKALEILYDEFTVVQKGDIVEVSDLAQARSPHNLLAVAVERLSRQAALTMDEIARDAWTTGGAHPKTYYSDATAVQINAAKTDIVVADVLQARDVRRAVAYLASVGVPRVGATLGSDGQYHGGAYLVVSSVGALPRFVTIWSALPAL